ncbi:hypothetical protein ACIQUF_04500 [Pseudomonas sp. NPDC090233]|uniref:hypothetical protein n=1 Tax=Pseudomonas sp. NPDC090233 TaxID=3364479 RepID=UPI00383BDB81
MRILKNSMMLKITPAKTFAAVVTLLFCAEKVGQSMPFPPKTFYFGRYAITAPTNGLDIWSSYEVVEERITLISHNGKRDLAAHTTELIATLNREHNAGYLDAYDQTVPLDTFLGSTG